MATGEDSRKVQDPSEQILSPGGGDFHGPKKFTNKIAKKKKTMGRVGKGGGRSMSGTP